MVFLWWKTRHDNDYIMSHMAWQQNPCNVSIRRAISKAKSKAIKRWIKSGQSLVWCTLSSWQFFHTLSCPNITNKSFRWLSTRLKWLQCFSDGDSEVLIWAIDSDFDFTVAVVLFTLSINMKTLLTLLRLKLEVTGRIRSVQLLQMTWFLALQNEDFFCNFWEKISRTCHIAVSPSITN